jgi:hypothetical protein
MRVSTAGRINYHWFSIMLAWLFKSAVLRYGGISAYRALLPLFLGLILGEFGVAVAWVFIDAPTASRGM